MQGALNATDLAPYIVNVFSFNFRFNGQRFTNSWNYFSHLLTLRNDLIAIHCIIIYIFIIILFYTIFLVFLQSVQQSYRITNAYLEYLNLYTDFLLGVEYMIYVLGMLLAVHTQLVKNEFQSEINCINTNGFTINNFCNRDGISASQYFGARMMHNFSNGIYS